MGAGAVGLILFGQILAQLAQFSIQRWQVDRQQKRLDADREQVLQERARLTEDPVYVEGLIRSTFKLAKPTEYVVPIDHTRE